MVNFNMKNITSDVGDIPDVWIYKYYADKFGKPINQPFDGRQIRIRSFTNRDTTPSLFIYLGKGDRYYWKDHSSQNGGDAIDFVKHLLSKTYTVAVQQIIKDFDEFIESGKNLSDYDNAKIEVVNIEYNAIKRAWDFNDLNFWAEWKITAHTVRRYNVEPLRNFIITKNGIANNIYSSAWGFYSKVEGLYQIYQPNNTNCKYINTKKDYLIGSDQLLYMNNTCIIVSGLKDLMALESIGLNIETVAPKSENTLLHHDKIEKLKSQYDHVITMFDNDEPGIRAMETYKRIYNIPYIHVHLEQDLAKNNKRYDIDFLKNHYTLLIDKKIN